MNSQKKIEINQSSLLGLKAELLRKKSEVSTAKYSQEINPPKIKKKKLVTKLDKANEGVIERDKRDAEEIQEELDELKKSQKVLEAKAKLYDNLVNDPGGTSNSNIDISGFLVDFKQKCQDEPPKEEAEEKEEAESDSCYNNGEYSDEDEWVDFVDCLGRTKRCHRDDLEEMKKQDEKLNKSLHGDGEKKENTSINEKANEAELPQLCSEDMKREIMRQKWEEQERNLIDKKNVHYQDILFDGKCWLTHGKCYLCYILKIQIMFQPKILVVL
ncbi:hypothetical protein RUM44_012558 [Polyplax serrata]|uniref:CCDC174 alpha/beta GRSR domain-containing protein n=1 Tax=Polyplax serrata TaxID=468196 RepID=A0ABR1BBN8_POLSC